MIIRPRLRGEGGSKLSRLFTKNLESGGRKIKKHLCSVQILEFPVATTFDKSWECQPGHAAPVDALASLRNSEKSCNPTYTLVYHFVIDFSRVHGTSLYRACRLVVPPVRKPTARKMSAHAEDQANELEALASIYGDAFKQGSEGPNSFSLLLEPELDGGAKANHVAG